MRNYWTLNQQIWTVFACFLSFFFLFIYFLVVCELSVRVLKALSHANMQSLNASAIVWHRAGYRTSVLLWYRPNSLNTVKYRKMSGMEIWRQMTKWVNIIYITKPVCMQHAWLCQDLILLLIGCTLVFCRKNTRSHPETGLTMHLCNVIFCQNRLDKINIKKSIIQDLVLRSTYRYWYRYRKP